MLGPLEVALGGSVVDLGPPKQRALLGELACHGNQAVSTGRLLRALWDDDPPPSAGKNLQVYVHRLRRILGEQRIVRRSPGYALLLGPNELDTYRFRRFVGDAHAAMADRRPADARGLLVQALGLWRGPAFADVQSISVGCEAAGLEEERLAALELRLQAELGLGRHGEVVAELVNLVVAHPLREQLRGQLMVALYRSGRRAEALAAYREGRRLLVEELGLDPSPRLQELERAILAGNPALDLLGSPGGVLLADFPEAPAQLPADLAEFTGRADILRQMDGLLDVDPVRRPAAVVVSAVAGMAGVGKTALAVHWAHRVRDRFPDGQLYINLRGYEPALPMRPLQALALLLHGLGVAAEQVPTELEQAAGLYRSLLADKRVLVVLDNARSANQVRPLLPAGPGCLVLVTSRDRLAGLVAREGARRLTLDVLTPAEAYTLLERILGRDRVAAEPLATAELARVCALLPLALRIAAANLADHPRRSIASYVAELEAGNRLAALEVEGDQQVAVRAAFGLSCTVLAPDARRLFRLLGLAPGPDVTADTAAALTDTTYQQAGRLLDQLAGAHLLSEHETGRYGLHDLLRQYAAERARAEDTVDQRLAATRRLFDWYLGAVDAAARLLYSTMLRLPLSPPHLRQPVRLSDHRQALAWLDAERANLLAAVQHTAEHGPRPVAWLLADALRGYFWLRMHTIDWLAIGHAALVAAEAENDLRAQAAAQLSLADAHLCQNQYRQAIERYTQALTLNQKTAWLDGQAAALGNLGLVYWELGRLDEAVRHYEQALALDRQTGRLAGQAASLGNLGQVHRELGRLEQATDHSTQALTLHRQTGARGGAAIDLTTLGEADHALGRFDHALDHLSEALTLHREVGNRGAEADTLRVLAQVHRDAGHHAHALELAHTGLALARDVGERRLQADALNTVATIHQRLGQHSQAIEHHQQALHLASETEARYPEVVALLGLAAAHQHLDHLNLALADANRALTLSDRAGYRVLEGQAYLALANLHRTLDQPGRAIEHGRQALAISRETEDRLGQARSLLALGHALCDIDGTGAAQPYWRQALDLFADIGTPEADRIRELLEWECQLDSNRPGFGGGAETRFDGLAKEPHDGRTEVPR